MKSKIFTGATTVLIGGLIATMLSCDKNSNNLNLKPTGPAPASLDYP